MGYKRSDRVGDLIRKEVAELLLRGEIKDPRIGFVTITVVRMSPDMRSARIFFSQIGEDADIKDSLEGLNSASGYIRRYLAKTLDLKQIPTVKFEYDDSIEYSDHISKVMKDLHD